MFTCIWFRRSAMSSLDSIPVSRAMTREVKTIQENEIIQQTCKIMIQKDIVRHLAERPVSFSSPVNQLMSKPVVTIHPNASLQDALATMQARNIRRLLVMSDDGNNMAGIITDKDIIRYIARNDSVSSGVINEEVLARNREMAEHLHTSLLDDILHKRP